MSTQILINEDQTVEAKWTGKRGRGSLFQLAAESNADLLNRLTRKEIAACLLAARAIPFPLGDERDVYERTLELVTPDVLAGYVQAYPRLGDLRSAVIKRAGGSFNAPIDTYLRCAAEGKTETAYEDEFAKAEAFGQMRLAGVIE